MVPMTQFVLVDGVVNAHSDIDDDIIRKASSYSRELFFQRLQYIVGDPW